ncbi:MAG: AsmA-like C-terminal region-containing protein, partial [Pseudomonadota bacterium]
RHGSALMPLDVEVNFSGVETDDAKLKSDIAATIAGTVGVGTVKAGLRFQGGTEAPLSGEVEASLEADYENTADLLKQLGWSMVDLGETGSAQLKLTANGIPQDGISVAVDTMLSGVGLTAEQKVSFSPAYTPSYTGDFRLKSEDTEPLVRSLGYAFPAMGLGTPVDVSGTLSGDGWSGKVSGFDGRIGQDHVKADLAYEGKGSGTSDGWHWTGSLSTERIAVPWFTALVTGEVIVPDDLALAPTEAQSSTDKQPSVWPQRVFGKPYYSGLSADLEIEANEAVFSDAHKVQKPRFKLRLRPSEIGLSELAGRFGDGTLEGRVLLQNMEGEVSLSGLVSLNGASASEVLWDDGVRPLVDGRLTITSQFEGVGRSLEAVMASLGGGGSLQLDDARIRRLNPSAFGLLTEAADRELTLDEDTVKPLVDSHLDSGHLKVEEAVTPFTISSGALRIAETSFETQSDVETLEAFAGATLNLVDLTVDGSLALNVSSAALDDEPVSGAAPEIAVLFIGPVDAPQRSLDIQPLLGYLTVRRFEQEVRRVEILQADILEKQRLSRYARWVSAEEAREQREAEEAERLRLLEEERRLEEERLQEEARAAEEARLLREAEERAAEVERVRLEREALQRALAEEEEQRRQAEAVAEEAARKRAEALERIGRQQSGSNLTGVNERPLRAPAQSRERRLPPAGAPLELRPLAR